MVRRASLEDIARYSCQAENVRAQTELELRGADEKIEVADDAETAGDRAKDVTKGQDVVFTVPFGKGLLKTPEAEWTFQGKRLQDSERVSVRFETSSNTYCFISFNSVFSSR